jgi:hypothetical protein
MDEAERLNAPRGAYAERYAAGKAPRRQAPRETLGEAPPRERDPLTILDQSDRGRLTTLLPLRHELMAQSAFAFLRGGVG